MKSQKIILKKYEIIGFLYSSLLSMATSAEETIKAIDHLIAPCEDPDLLEIYIEILDYKGSRFDLLKQFERINHYKWYAPLSADQLSALVGIAFTRNTRVIGGFDDNYDPVTAKAALKAHPEVKNLFREVFPFIEL